MSVNAAIDTARVTATDAALLARIAQLDAALVDYFAAVQVVDPRLTRQLVSFQANKTRRHYRWYKYKEAFSADLVEYLLQKYPLAAGKILDPFAGAGTALFACAARGYAADGIELLPLGQQIIQANILARGATKHKIMPGLAQWLHHKPWTTQGNTQGATQDFQVLRITDNAYPPDTHYKISRYLSELAHTSAELKQILLFALLCILESISYTRKDGQCLRWDYRAARGNGKNPFDKGHILDFDTAISSQLAQIKSDLAVDSHKQDLLSFMQPDVAQEKGQEIGLARVSVFNGSCLDILPTLDSHSYTGIITSPPYCNRYDYTRTYALEHAILGVTESQLVALRQAMLSCTVENKAKQLGAVKPWQTAIHACDTQTLLQAILNYVDYKQTRKELNNSGIARMLRGYFYEMACVIQECHRVLNTGGRMFMVNDNVRYAGAAVSVDMLLAKIAEQLGFSIENILVLPQGKGNSSQQMGRHGRAALRKCVYVWKKIA